jgi:hypothetical protein
MERENLNQATFLNHLSTTHIKSSEVMKTKLTVYTSFIEKNNIERIKELNLLPIFIVRSIGKIEEIRKWSGTPLHFKELSPSKELFWDWRDGRISDEVFEKRFIIELAFSGLHDAISRMSELVKTCGANGVVLLGIGDNTLHRSIVADLLWRTGLLEEEPIEL